MEVFIICTATFVRLWMHSCCCCCCLSNQRRKVEGGPDGRFKLKSAGVTSSTVTVQS